MIMAVSMKAIKECGWSLADSPKAGKTESPEGNNY